MDLNGIVHNCIHGNDQKRSEKVSKLDHLEEVWAAVMQAIDELVHTIKPTKVLLLAVDGVAPRAKMN
jgi:5'-3' exoribonuclease 2